jgi:hypothetical protein
MQRQSNFDFDFDTENYWLTDRQSQCDFDFDLACRQETKACRTFIRIYSLVKSERLSANIKLNLHKALIRSVLTYACPAWELATDTYLLKLKRMQNKVLRTIGNVPRFTLVRDLHTAFNLPYV